MERMGGSGSHSRLNPGRVCNYINVNVRAQKLSPPTLGKNRVTCRQRNLYRIRIVTHTRISASKLYLRVPLQRGKCNLVFVYPSTYKNIMNINQRNGIPTYIVQMFIHKKVYHYHSRNHYYVLMFCFYKLPIILITQYKIQVNYQNYYRWWLRMVFLNKHILSRNLV